ncbi:MAG: FtsW/RodA/SpoVE family cell cycle protein, partial [Mycobacteriales bacterium]
MSTALARSYLTRPADRRARGRRLPGSVDWVLVASVLALTAVGALLVWSATRGRLSTAGLDPQRILDRHLINIAIGLSLGLVATMIDNRMLRAYALVVYAVSCLGLIGVLVFGTTIHGAHSWIVVGGGLQVQPSEFAKVGLIASMAVLLGERRDGEDAPRGSDVVLVLLMAALPLALVLLQPDVGTAMVLAFVILGVLAVSGARARWLAGLLVAGALAAALAVHAGALKDYQVERFTSFA